MTACERQQKHAFIEQRLHLAINRILDKQKQKEAIRLSIKPFNQKKVSA